MGPYFLLGELLSNCSLMEGINCHTIFGVSRVFSDNFVLNCFIFGNIGGEPGLLENFGAFRWQILQFVLHGFFVLFLFQERLLSLKVVNPLLLDDISSPFFLSFPYARFSLFLELPVSGIFLGKNNFGYQDKTEYVVTPNVHQDTDYDTEDVKKR